MEPSRPTFEHVFEQHFAYVWRSVLRFGASRSDAEDLAQDVFVVVHRRLEDFDATRPIKPWLFGITRNRVRDHLRQKQRDPSIPDGSGRVGRSESASHAVEASQLVRTALRKLPEDRRAVFIGFELDRLTMREVAEALEVSQNTCWSRLRVARVEFREAIRMLSEEDA